MAFCKNFHIINKYMDDKELQKEKESRLKYVCEGECGAELTQEEWERDATNTCKDEHCSHFGIPFTREKD